MNRPNRNVADRRHSSLKSLDFFPTPPWATRALAESVLPRLGLSLDGAVIWDPCAGQGHMAHVLAEYGVTVVHSDVHDYGIGSVIGSFVGEGPDVIGSHCEAVAADWIVFNPPFPLAEQFVKRALREADHVAMLARTHWIDGKTRYQEIFSTTPPLAVAQFAERVPMHQGRWEPDGDTMTPYAWYVWLRGACVETRLMWIPPGLRETLERPDDRARFGKPMTGGLL